MREQFQHFNFKADTLLLIEKSNAIIGELQRDDYTLTLRQLYYQLVSREIIANEQTEYKRLIGIITDARLAGLVDWDAIEDRTRNLQSIAHWDDPGEIIQSAANSYAKDKWEDQPSRVEVWVEKDAMSGVVQAACEPLDVPYFSCRGYPSQSESYAAGKRLARYIANGQTPVIIHLGDHDPSGIDMTRDIRDRLKLFAGQSIEVNRIALNMDQIQRYHPPPNPVKTTDSRYQSYRDVYGDESWELDALSPQAIGGLIRAAVESYIDRREWRRVKTRESTEIVGLKKAAAHWPAITEFLTTK
jgi:hypothetical protein